MKYNRLLIATLITFGMANTSTFADEKPVTEQLVDTMTALAGGPHQGYRANHAKGVMAEGVFIPSEDASSLSIAPHFQHQSTTVLVRYSDATGVPTIPDSNGNSFPKGIAIRFNLSDGSYTDIVSISTNGFPVSNPEDFLGLLTAIKDSSTSKTDPSPIQGFLNTHPAASRWVSMPKPAPVSFANLPFYGVNAFKFTNAQGKTQYGRYQIVPVAGEKYLSEQEAKAADNNYLMQGIVGTLSHEEVKYDLYAQIANKDDNVNDPTAVWPSDRTKIKLGTITLKSAVSDSISREKSIMFNPLTLTSGIAASEDPILLARPAAYAISYGRRIGN